VRIDPDGRADVVHEAAAAQLQRRDVHRQAHAARPASRQRR
jgi:hypothetical protein